MATPGLKSNCLICRAGVENYQHTGFHIPWIEDVTMSLCEVLPLDRYLQPVLETAVYCDSCLFTIRDIDFTQKSLSSLQRRLDDSRARIVSLIENNVEEIGSIEEEESILGSFDLGDDYSYEQVLKSVWESVSSDKKPVLVEANGNGHGGTSHHSSGARPKIPYPHRIILHEPQGVSDDDSSESDSSTEAEHVPVGSKNNGSTSRQGLRKRKTTSSAAPQKSSKKTKTQVGPKKSTKKSNTENSQPRTRDDVETVSNLFESIAAQQVTPKTEVDYNASLPLFRCGCGAAFATRNHLKMHRRTTCLITHPDGIKEETETVDNGDDEDALENDDDDGEDVPKRGRKPNSTNKKKYSNKKKFSCTFEGCQFRCDNEGRFQVHNRKHEGDEVSEKSM